MKSRRAPKTFRSWLLALPLRLRVPASGPKCPGDSYKIHFQSGKLVCGKLSGGSDETSAESLAVRQKHTYRIYSIGGPAPRLRVAAGRPGFSPHGPTFPFYSFFL